MMPDFSDTVRAYITGTNGKPDKEHIARLASAFGVGMSTIERWADGTAHPHENIQLIIVKWIEDDSK